MDESTPGITSAALAERICAVIRDIVTAHAPHGATVTQVHGELVAQGLVVSRETATHWLRSEMTQGHVACRRGMWVPGSRRTILVWEKPPQEVPYDEWAAYQPDDGPPGAWVPNMPDEWKLRWKAKMLGQRSPGLSKLRIEIRKTVIERHGHGYAQVLFVVYATGNVATSQNGTAVWSPTEIAEMPLAIGEAREVMRLYAQHHQPEQAQESA